MKTRIWDNLWRDDEKRKLWTIPEQSVLALLPMLKEEMVRRTLDLGCGVGRHAVALASEGFEAHAIDASRSAIAYCRDWLKEEELHAKIRYGDMQVLPYPDGFFDFVLSWNVIYHTTRKKMVAILGEIVRVLRDGGLLYLTLISTRNMHCGGGTEVEPNTFADSAKIDGQHLHHYSDEEDVRDLFSRFHIESIKEAEQGPSGQVVPESWHWNILARKQP